MTSHKYHGVSKYCQLDCLFNRFTSHTRKQPRPIQIKNPVYAWFHYADVIMGAMESQITSLTSFYSTVYSGTDQRKHQSSASLAFVLGIHRWPMNSPYKGPVTRKMFPFDDAIMRVFGVWLWLNSLLLHWYRGNRTRDMSKLMMTSSNGNTFRATGPLWGPMTRSFDVFFYLRMNKRGWGNNRDAGDLRCHCAHYGVTVMWWVNYCEVMI